MIVVVRLDMRIHVIQDGEPFTLYHNGPSNVTDENFQSAP